MEQIDIMPKREGSGPMGTSELLSVGTPLLAVLNLTPIGRGILGAIGTMATIPEASKAGVFSLSGTFSRRSAKLFDKGAFVFPDRTRNIELSTAGFAERLRRNPTIDNDIFNEVSLPQNIAGFSTDDLASMMKAKQDLNRVDISTESDAAMAAYNVEDTTGGFFNPPNRLYSGGSIRIREGRDANVVADTIAHEGTHLLDYLSDRELAQNMLNMGSKDIEYGMRLAEQRAFTAGARADFDEALISVGSDTVIHPMLSVAEGKVSTYPFSRYVSTMHEAARAGGKEVDGRFIQQYSKLLNDEAFKLQRKLDTDPVFRAKVDKAARMVEEDSLSWTFSHGQQKLIKEAKGNREKELVNYTNQIKKGK